MGPAIRTDRSAAPRLAMAGAFAAAAQRYWLSVYPCARRQLCAWRCRAAEIPTPGLRHHALAAHRTKRGNPEGAAAFATLVPAAYRPTVVRALVAFQALYDYVDCLSEQDAYDRAGNARELHNALVVALDPSARHLNYYALYPHRDDGGYLEGLVDACRTACDSLPSYATVAQTTRRLAARIPDYQQLNSTAGSYDAFARWAREKAPPAVPLEWWEFAAAAGSSLAVHAMVASAADPALSKRHAVAIETAYSTEIGALHTLLDSLVDQCEDAMAGHHSFVSHYASDTEAADRLGTIASRALELARALPAGEYHAVILAGMVGHYLSAPEASLPRAREATRSVLAAMGVPGSLALVIHRARRRGTRVP
jgi:tetraprenyl-beta-curcumene synthase